MAFYFASDVHAGLKIDGRTTEGEKRLVRWLDSVRGDAEAVFLLGDLFDFWFEYKRVVPKGFVRLLAKISELVEAGVPVHFFPGNHDMWIGDYLSRECGVVIHPEGGIMELADKTVYLAHGDYITSSEGKDKTLQKLFRSKIVRVLFSSLVHPDSAMKFGQSWSASSRKKHLAYCHVFAEEMEPVVKFARQMLESAPVDYFVFGHLHTPVKYPMNDRSVLFVLGAWITDEPPVYGVLDASGFRLEPFEG